MSDESPTTAPPPKKPPWPTVDPLLQRTAWIIGIIVGALTLITQYVIPYFLFFAVLLQFALVAWYVYKWRTTEVYLSYWFDQYLFIFQCASSVLQVAFHINKVGGNCHVGSLAALWIVASTSWFALAVLSAYGSDKAAKKRDEALWESISIVADCISNLSNTQTRIVDELKNVIHTQHDIAVVQDLAIKKDALDARLTELSQKESVSPPAPPAKKRRPRTDPPTKA